MDLEAKGNRDQAVPIAKGFQSCAIFFSDGQPR